MLVKVKKDFIDKHTKVLHEKGSTFSCGEARFKEIIEAGDLVELIPEEEIKAEKPIKTEKTKTERTTKNGSNRKKV